MPLPILLTFRGLESSEALTHYVQAKADKLPTFCDRILRCAVVVEAEHRHVRHGERYRVRIDLTTPGHEVVGEERGADAHAVVDATFDHVERQLAELSRRQRHEVRSHASLRDLAPNAIPRTGAR